LLGRGPGEARVELRRRTSEGPRSVTEYLQSDHVRLDAIMAEVERLTRTASFVEARAAFGSFVAGLDWHIDVEEQVVFPAFEELTGTPRGPTTVMRMEHVDIRGHMQRVTAALGTQSVDAVGNALRELTTLLATHNMKEERMLYPMTDRALGTPTAQEELVQRVERF
jgi:iron-sulfur cluster repair protein YtfE (RIC family)